MLYPYDKSICIRVCVKWDEIWKSFLSRRIGEPVNRAAVVIRD